MSTIDINTDSRTAYQQQSSPIKASAKREITQRDERRHSREDALNEREFESLVRATYEMKDGQAIEARAALYLAGRLGLRGGEIAHFDSSWVDWQEGVIEVPDHQRCTKGTREGEVCGYCRQRAVEELKANNLTVQEAVDAICHEYDPAALSHMTDDQIIDAAHELRDRVNITYREAISRRWKPKTPQSARQIPFDFDVRVEMVLENFLQQHDGWEKSKSTVNRRINRIAEHTEADVRIYPHALRATAASSLAKRDVSAYSLMSMMGWADIATARIYISSNEDRAASEIRSKTR